MSRRVVSTGVLLLAWGCTPPPTPAPAPAPVPIPAPQPPPSPPPGADSGTPAELLRLHNDARARSGKAAMTASVQLQTLAQSHADRMARSGVMSHDAAGDGPFGSRLAASGYRYRAAAENVAWNHPTPAAVMAGWMKSPGHRVNVLGPYSQAGFAVACGRAGDPYWCVVFATPAAASERLAAGEVRTGGDRLEPGQRAFP